MLKFGVDTFIWSENFSEKDLHLIEKSKKLGFDVIETFITNPDTYPVKLVKSEVKKVGIEVVTATVLGNSTNLISPDPETRKQGIEYLKKIIDINNEIGSEIIGGVNYAGWGYLTRKCRTDDEWSWSVEAMREVAAYARETGKVNICVEPVNRFETHFLNIAEDAVRYCKDVGMDNMKIHLDSFHMIREELNFTDAVNVCSKKYLGYVHVCENNRGIPGTGLVPWEEFFNAIIKSGYTGPLVIESFDPSFEELAGMCAIWRSFADTGEDLAVQGLANLKAIEKKLKL
jgi:D-psicose/D-tagatose/L-ribulose 3-epimerase